MAQVDENGESLHSEDHFHVSPRLSTTTTSIPVPQNLDALWQTTLFAVQVNVTSSVCVVVMAPSLIVM